MHREKAIVAIQAGDAGSLRWERKLGRRWSLWAERCQMRPRSRGKSVKKKYTYRVRATQGKTYDICLPAEPCKGHAYIRGAHDLRRDRKCIQQSGVRGSRL